MDEGGRHSDEMSAEFLRTRERRAAMGRLASSLSHALGTPLNVIAGRAAMIGMGDLSPQEVRDNARIIEQQVRSITELLHRALRFLREGWEDSKTERLDQLAGRAAELCELGARARGVRIEVRAGNALEANIDAGAFQLVLTNLLSLAIAGESQGGCVRLSLERRHAEPPPSERGRVRGGDCACVSVRSSWQLDGALLDRVHEPWLAEPQPNRDQQLLLAVSFGVAREMRGWIEAETSEAQTTLGAYFPLSL
jgi:signal transduction histidine kinase